MDAQDALRRARQQAQQAQREATTVRGRGRAGRARGGGLGRGRAQLFGEWEEGAHEIFGNGGGRGRHEGRKGRGDFGGHNAGGGFQGDFGGRHSGKRQNGDDQENERVFGNRRDEGREIVEEQPVPREQMRFEIPERAAQPARQPRPNVHTRPEGHEEGGWFRAEE
jgi:hypothetical protein